MEYICKRAQNYFFHVIVDPMLPTVYAYCQIKYYIITYMGSQVVHSILWHNWQDRPEDD